MGSAVNTENSDQTMRAVLVTSFGGPEKLELQRVTIPVPRHNEVLVRVRAVGINPVDWKTRSGAGVARNIRELPAVLGWDVAGTVERIGRNGSSLKHGDSVMGMVNFPYPGGGYAEFVTAPISHVVKTPLNLSWCEAAALPLAGLTAWQALFGTANIKADDRVLIHGVVGGVGHLAVQLAKWAGAYVIGSASPQNHEFAYMLGCDEVFGYLGDDLWSTVGDIDAVVDTVGGETRMKSLEVLNENGIVVTLQTGSSDCGLDDPRVTKILVHPDSSQLERMVALSESGVLRVETRAFAELEQIEEAHRLSETGHGRGRIVVTI